MNMEVRGEIEEDKSKGPMFGGENEGENVGGNDSDGGVKDCEDELMMEMTDDMNGLLISEKNSKCSEDGGENDGVEDVENDGVVDVENDGTVTERENVTKGEDEGETNDREDLNGTDGERDEDVEGGVDC